MADCNAAHHDSTGKPARRRWGPEGPAIHQVHTCLVCGTEFKPKRAGRTTTCSQACGWKWTGEKRKAKFRLVSVVRMRRCAVCSSIYAQAKTEKTCSPDCAEAHRRAAIKAYSEAKSQADKSERSCAECGSTFQPEYGDKRRAYCSDECSTKAHRRVTKKVRRARKRAGAVEPVNPTKVFERDGWRCQLCGIKTPRGKRGTCAPNAPEMDHIVPLADGGDHSYRNVQTACRTCNIKKGAGAGGQLLLFG